VKPTRGPQKKNSALKLVLLLVGLGCFVVFDSTAAERQSTRPNIVWLVSEDNSARWLKLYEREGAPMPNVERLAADGLVFNHAFSCAPVCSVARSTLISGCYAPRIGAQYHRRTELAPMPDGVDMFPAYLRRAGYYTANNSKEDYNLIKTPGVWDASSGKASYRNRKPGQPFFHVQNFGRTHESSLHFSREAMAKSETKADPAAMKLFAYHPDTATFRYSYARYLDLHRQLDVELGRFLKQLEDDGLMEDTIIFYYGDHGGILPRSKGYLYESGLQVPLVVYFPEKWKHLAPAALGSRINGFVNFTDFGPTVLNLANAEIPKGIDGRAFLGKGVDLAELNARDTAFSYADRFDEKYDLVRSLRVGRFKYLRSFQPFNVDGLHNDYRYEMLAYSEWRDLYRAGKLNPVQRQFFERRPAESLFDVESDPDEVKNLAGDPAFAEELAKLRDALRQRVKGMPDLSFYPEPCFLEQGLNNPVEFGRDHREEISRLVDIADLSLRPFAAARGDLVRALDSGNPWERYWALIACSTFGEEAGELRGKVKEIAESGAEKNLVRVRAAEFLGLIRASDPRPVILETLNRSLSLTEADLILNTVVLLTDAKPGYRFDLSSVEFPKDWMKSGKGPSLLAERLTYLNTR
jgi:arylsulfatase A-like enzyme